MACVVPDCKIRSHLSKKKHMPACASLPLISHHLYAPDGASRLCMILLGVLLEGKQLCKARQRASVFQKVVSKQLISRSTALDVYA